MSKDPVRRFIELYGLQRLTQLPPDAVRWLAQKTKERDQAMGYEKQSSERQRFRSFTERYLIARAPHFKVGNEEEDAWQAMLKAESIYQRLNAFSSRFDPKPDPALEETDDVF